MFLATTDIKEFWDASDELILLGPWCVKFDDPNWLDGLRHRRAPNVWDDREALAQAGQYALDFQPVLFEKLGAFLNQAHGTDYSPRYWRIVLGGWGLFLTHHVLDRLAQVKGAVAAFPQVRSLSLDRRDYYTPRSEGDFINASLTSRQDLQLYSDILRFLKKDAPEKRLPLPAKAARLDAAGPQGFKGRAKHALSLLSHARVRYAMPDVVTDELYPASRLVWTYALKTGGRAWPLLRQPPIEGPAPDPKRREGLESLFQADDFQKVFSSALPWTLPTLYLEGFKEARTNGIAARSQTPKAVFASTSVYFDDAFKLAAAEWTHRGAKLWGMQHGGVYGMSRISAGETHEQAISDRYCAWGWAKTDGGAKLRDVPVPNLSKLKQNWSFGAGGLLYVTPELLRNSNSITSGPMGWQWERVFDWRERFVGALGPLRADLLVRPPSFSYGWASAARLRRKFPDARLDDYSKTFYERLRESRLVVIDHSSTTLIESLALDVPTVLFWDDALWEMRPKVKPFFDALRAARILHANPESAAAHVSQIYGDPAAWWKRPDVQAARKAFAETFARTSDDWAGDWAKMTRQELI